MRIACVGGGPGGLLFALLHQGQLARAWAPLMLLFVVGIVLTTVRARYDSLAASWIVVNTSHLKGKLPAGQNVLCFDNHVEWRTFKQSTASPIGQQNSSTAFFFIQNP